LLDGAAIAMWAQPAMYAVRVMIISSNSDVDSGGHFVLQGMFYREPGEDVLYYLGNIAKTVINKTAEGYDANLSTDDTLKTLKITVTGQAAVTLRWVAFVEMVQVSFAAP
jgi:hypothetical protein